MFNEETLDSAQKGLERLKSALRPAAGSALGLTPGVSAVLTAQAEETRKAFVDCMDADFNSPGALAALYELVRAINSARDAGAKNEQLQEAQKAFRDLAAVLGLQLAEKKSSEKVGRFIDLLMEVRSAMRNQKNWAMSDMIRDRLKELGVTIEDNKDGTTWHW
jgi:cysteinyl-tRNA synthetase